MQTLSHPAPPVHSNPSIDLDETFEMFPDFYPDECPVTPDDDDFDPGDFVPSEEDTAYWAWASPANRREYDVTRLGLYDRIASGEAAEEIDEFERQMEKEYEFMARTFAAMERMERGLDGCDHGGSFAGHMA